MTTESTRPDTCPESSSGSQGWSLWVVCAVVAVVGLGIGVALGTHSLPAPTSDEAFYRSPAAEFVQHGRLAIPCLGRMLPRTAIVYSCHPPLYQLLLVAWYECFGFTLWSSLGYTFFVHVLNAILITVVASRILSGELVSSRSRGTIIAAIGLIHVANLAYFDRQEETALLWIWIDVLAIRSLGYVPSVTSGVLVALSALTSPWVGVLGLMIVFFRTCFLLLARRRRDGDETSVAVPPRAVGSVEPSADRSDHWLLLRGVAQLGLTSLVTASLLGAWIVVMESRYPGIIHDQFVGLMRHISGHAGPRTLAGNLKDFRSSVLFNRSQVPILMLTLVLFPAYCRRVGWSRLPPTAAGLFAAGVCGSLLVAALRPEAYTYLGAVQILLLPCFGPAFLRYLQGPPPAIRLGMIALGLCTAFAFQQAASLVWTAFTLPESERYTTVCRRLQARIPPGELVDLTGRHWYCFQGRNPWYEAYFLRDLPSDLLQARWMVLPHGIGAPDCIREFELVEQTDVAGDPEQSYAYSLWKRRDGPREPDSSQDPTRESSK